MKQWILSLFKLIFWKEIPTNYLIKNGMKVGKNFQRLGSSFFDISHCWLIEIGDNVTISTRCVLLAHDASIKKALGVSKIGKIKIANNVFIGAGVTILPNVEIGENSIIGAGSVVTKSFPSNVVIAGNPAKIICTHEEYILKNKLKMKKSPVYDKTYRREYGITSIKKNEMIKNIKDIGFVD